MASRIEVPTQSAKTDTHREYEVLREAFRRFVWAYEHSAEHWEIFEEIITSRAAFLIDRALQGLRIDFDEALALLRNFNSFVSERERQQHEILVAAIDNLIDFAAAEECAMLDNIDEAIKNEDAEVYEATFERYNLTYAQQENEQVLYAASIAAWWLTVDAETIVTFMTQGDERVRPWHLSHEGVSYPKREFPPELIPPIEWACRCYLDASGFASVRMAVGDQLQQPSGNPIFRESLATGGRIFSNAHPYFSKLMPPKVQQITQKLKEQFMVCPK